MEDGPAENLTKKELHKLLFPEEADLTRLFSLDNYTLFVKGPDLVLRNSGGVVAKAALSGNGEYLSAQEGKRLSQIYFSPPNLRVLKDSEYLYFVSFEGAKRRILARVPFYKRENDTESDRRGYGRRFGIRVTPQSIDFGNYGNNGFTSYAQVRRTD